MAGKLLKTVAALGVVLTFAASAVASTPDVASMTLQPSDVPGAKVTHQGAVSEKGYLAAYEREFAFSTPSGSARLIDIEAETMVAATPATATKDVAAAEAGFRSKTGRALFIKTVAKQARVKTSAVAVGPLRKVAGYDQGFQMAVSVKTKLGRVYETVVYLRLDRVAVFMLEVGLRPIGAGTTSKYTSLIASHIGTALAPAAVSPPTITGTAQQGQTLSASPGTWTADDATFAYQWQHCDAAGANCTDIAGATAQTYTVAATDVNTTLRVVVKASNRFGAPTASSAQTAVVT
jgi:hypothetical protein